MPSLYYYILVLRYLSIEYIIIHIYIFFLFSALTDGQRRQTPQGFSLIIMRFVWGGPKPGVSIPGLQFFTPPPDVSNRNRR